MISKLVWTVPNLLAQFLLAITPPSLQRLYFGSDIYERYQSTYTWFANQFGHFAIGIVIAFVGHLAGSLSEELFGGDSLYFAIPIWSVLLLIYIAKETADYIIADGFQGLIAIDRRELLLDGATDVGFVTLGLLTTLAMIYGHWSAGVGMVVLSLVYGVAMSRLFIPAKELFDQSGLPLYFRLERFERHLVGHYGDTRLTEAPGANEQTKAAARALEGFIENGCDQDQRPGAATHVAIYGPPGSGKRSLGIGLGVARVLRGRKVRYVTATRLLHDKRLAEGQPGTIGLKEADTVIVDDIATEFASRAGPGEGMIAARLSGVPPWIPDALSGKQTVAVLAVIDQASLKPWLAELASILGVEADSILAIRVETPEEPGPKRMYERLGHAIKAFAKKVEAQTRP